MLITLLLFHKFWVLMLRDVEELADGVKVTEGEKKMILTESLQGRGNEAEEAFSQGFDALNQSLSDTIPSDALSSPTKMANYMGQIAAAMNKLFILESSTGAFFLIDMNSARSSASLALLCDASCVSYNAIFYAPSPA
ncbi:hypothetical protein Tco_0935883 [Tanacetum coccineum]